MNTKICRFSYYISRFEVLKLLIICCTTHRENWTDMAKLAATDQVVKLLNQSIIRHGNCTTRPVCLPRGIFFVQKQSPNHHFDHLSFLSAPSIVLRKRLRGNSIRGNWANGGESCGHSEKLDECARKERFIAPAALLAISTEQLA